MKYQDDFLLTLAYLMGERTIQSSTRASRGTFTQKTLEEVYRAYKWPFSTVRATLTVNSGVASLASNFDVQHGLDTYFYAGSTQRNLEEINEEDQTQYQTGDQRYWIEAQGDGTYLIKTKDTVSSVNVIYQSKAPTLGASVYTPFEDDMTVALGARRYIKLSQDPNADISQDEALFQKRLGENIAATQVSNPKRRARFINDANGHRTGGGFE